MSGILGDWATQIEAGWVRQQRRYAKAKAIDDKFFIVRSMSCPVFTFNSSTQFINRYAFSHIAFSGKAYISVLIMISHRLSLS